MSTVRYQYVITKKSVLSESKVESVSIRVNTCNSSIDCLRIHFVSLYFARRRILFLPLEIQSVGTNNNNNKNLGKKLYDLIVSSEQIIILITKTFESPLLEDYCYIISISHLYYYNPVSKS